MSRLISLLARLLPAELRKNSGDEIVADLELIRLENGRIPAREVGGFVAESLRLRAVDKTLSGSIVTSLTWSLGLLVGLLVGAAASYLLHGMKHGVPPQAWLILAVVPGALLKFCFWSTRTFLWVTAISGGIFVILGVGIALLAAMYVDPESKKVSIQYASFAAGCLIVLIGSLALRRSPADLTPPKWSLLAIPCGVALGMFHVGGSLYALTVFVAVILAYWNPHPAIVLSSVPWLVGVGPMAVMEMFTERTTSADAFNLLGMLALTAIAMGWVIGNHRRNTRRSIAI
jgi:hypothetical protein